MTPPVRPRPAASLIVCRGTGTACEVLMGRRPAGARFAPSVWVFPGGGVDRDDYRAKPASKLDPSAASILHAGPALAQALGLAALRELAEETGLILGQKGDPGVTDNQGYQMFARLGLSPHLAPLRPLARAITPSQSPIRFHARFFLVRDGEFSGTLTPSSELPELAWINLNHARDLALMDVTAAMLDLITEVSHFTRLTYRQGRMVMR